MRSIRRLSALIVALGVLLVAAPAGSQEVAKRSAKRAAKEATESAAKQAAEDAAKKAVKKAAAPDAIDFEHGDTRAADEARTRRGDDEEDRGRSSFHQRG